MANHYPNLTDMLVEMGLPAIVPEPEVLKATVQRSGVMTLQQLIARALGDERLLLVEKLNDSALVVSEIGGPNSYKVTIEPYVPGR